MPLMRTLAISAATAVLLVACNEDKPVVAAVGSPAQAAEAESSPAEVTATTPATFASETKTFRDWTAVCNNINNCTAYGPAEDNSGFVMVKLEAGPNAKPVLLAGSWSLPSGRNPQLLNIDGRNYAGKMEQQDSETPLLKIDNPSDQLIRAIANGRAMTLTADGETANVSLAGAAAAFLWIDERQGRLGTTTALIRKGERDASTVPTAPTAPRVTVAPIVSQTNLPRTLLHQIAALPNVRECAAENTMPSMSGDWTVDRLAENTLLWSVPCGAGAYNFSQAYVLSNNDGSNPRPVNFPSSGKPQAILTNSSFDPESNTISAFGKGRGIGDCGQIALWAWTGTEFALLEEDTMHNCLGVHWEFWPSTWKASR